MQVDWDNKIKKMDPLSPTIVKNNIIQRNLSRVIIKLLPDAIMPVEKPWGE